MLSNEGFMIPLRPEMLEVTDKLLNSAAVAFKLEALKLDIFPLLATIPPADKSETLKLLMCPLFALNEPPTDKNEMLPLATFIKPVPKFSPSVVSELPFDKCNPLPYKLACPT